MHFFEELKRRNVFRVVGAYAVAAWLIAQGAVMLEGAFSLPDWIDTAAITALLVILPLVVLFAWFFEVTPQGIKLTRSVPKDESIAPQTGRKLDFAILGGLGVVAILLGINAFRGDAPTPAGSGSSIAVLPFVDMSPQGDQEYFSDGVTEELLNNLARIEGLQVAGRTSSFAFKNDNRDLREIGDLLAVDYILEGSVRKSGDNLRVTAQLIKADNGFHAWSQTYDRRLTEVFALQDEITRSIVDELSPFLPNTAKADALKSTADTDVDAYQLFLQARQLVTSVATQEALHKAIDMFDRVIAATPDYAPAHAWRAIALGTMIMDRPERLPELRASAERAQALDPDLPEVHHAIGTAYLMANYTLGEDTLHQAVASFGKAIELRPSFSLARNDLGMALSWLGDSDGFEKQLRIALEHDPALVDANFNLLTELISKGELDEAQRVVDRWMRIDPNNPLLDAHRVNIAATRGNTAEAMQLADRALDRTPNDAFLQSLGRIQKTTLGDFPISSRYIGSEDPQDALNYRLEALWFDGDKEGMRALLKAEPEFRRSPISAFLIFLPASHYVGDAQGIRDYFDREITRQGVISETLNNCNCSAASLVWALKETKHPRYGEVLKEWDTWIENRRKRNKSSARDHTRYGDWRLAHGDTAGAVAEFTTAIDGGWRNITFALGYRASVPDTPEFRPLFDRMRRLIDVERAKLGLPPLKQAP